MTDIIHRIGIHAPASEVYRALCTLSGLRGWWTRIVEGDEYKNGKITFTFQEISGEVKGKMVMEVDAIVPDKEVRWICKEGPPEWIDTHITFEIYEADKQTIVLFGHRYWKQAVEFTAHCSMKWAVFLLSLRAYVETGKGMPHPDDIKIDNWN